MFSNVTQCNAMNVIMNRIMHGYYTLILKKASKMQHFIENFWFASDTIKRFVVYPKIPKYYTYRMLSWENLFNLSLRFAETKWAKLKHA